MTSHRAADPLALRRRIEGLALRDDPIVHRETLAARAARCADPQAPLPPALQDGLARMGIERLYLHQAAALDRVRAGENLVVVTGTASGKSLCYNLPVLERLTEDSEARALYLFPTKALAQDQLKGLERWLPPGASIDARGRRKKGARSQIEHSASGFTSLDFIAGTYDGDTPPTSRSRLRDEANLVLTNPDMLHSGILPHHSRWAEFFTRLQFIVIDEIHVYRGIFGSHVANVLRRLERICRHYRSEPRWICASATIANPGELAGRLTTKEFSVVEEDGAPRGEKHFFFWNPPRVGKTGLERRSSNLEAKELLVELVRDGYQVIAFVKARLLTEVLLRYCQEDLRRDGGGLAAKVRSYRAGYLPAERRKIEAQLFAGELLGVISTNALELGVDVGGLDVAILVGYPGTIASTWQQAGRAGRRQAASAALLVAHDAPIDQYLMANPDYFFGRTPEHAVCDPTNPHLLLNHLRCAALEIPVARAEEQAFGEYAPAILDLLQERQVLREVKGRWFYARGDHPAASFSLRNAGENIYTILDASGPQNRVMGTIDEMSAFSQVHPQAVYMQEGETFFVDRLDLTEKVAYVHRADLDYYTQAVSDSHIDAEAPDLERRLQHADLFFGECAVHEKVTMFKKVQFGGRDSLGFGQIDLPHTTLHTTGLWLTPSVAAMRKALDHGRVPADGLVGIANVLTSVVSLHTMCDPHDLGTVVDMRETKGPTLYVYDKYPGGLGYAQRAYHRFEEILPHALRLIAGCGCEEGCPTCVGSPLAPHFQQDPDASMKGRIPDKEASLILLHAMLGLPDYEPRVPLAGARRLRAERLVAARAVVDEAAASEGKKSGAGRRKSPVATPVTAPTADEPTAAPPRILKPLPVDLRRKLVAQIDRLENAASTRGFVRRPESPSV